MSTDDAVEQMENVRGAGRQGRRRRGLRGLLTQGRAGCGRVVGAVISCRRRDRRFLPAASCPSPLRPALPLPSF